MVRPRQRGMPLPASDTCDCPKPHSFRSATQSKLGERLTLRASFFWITGRVFDVPFYRPAVQPSRAFSVTKWPDLNAPQAEANPVRASELRVLRLAQ